MRPGLDANEYLTAIVRRSQRGRTIVLNQKKVRLISDLLPGESGGIVARVQPCRYFESQATNEAAGLTIRNHRTHRVCFDGREMVRDNDNTLRRLDNSPAGNHIGVSVLAISSDLYAVMTLQSDSSRIDAEQLTASASGSLDWDDAVQPPVPTTLRELIERGMKRELVEECGLAPTGSDIALLEIMGFARFLHRAGKPEFFGLARLKVSVRELKILRPERKYLESHEWSDDGVVLTDAATFVKSLHNLLGRFGGSASLETCVKAVCEAVVDDPSIVSRLRAA